MEPWLPVVLALITLLGSVLVGWMTRNASVRAAKTAADEGAFIRAKDIYEGALNEQDERLDRIDADLKATREQLGETVRELAETRAELRAARAEISTLRRSVSQYEGRVIQLTEVLRLHQIEVPPWTLDPSDYGILPGSIPDPNQPARVAIDEDHH